jgi:hypothetical protein
MTQYFTNIIIILFMIIFSCAPATALRKIAATAAASPSAREPRMVIRSTAVLALAAPSQSAVASPTTASAVPSPSAAATALAALEVHIIIF